MHSILRALAIVLLVAETAAQFIANSQTWATVFFGLLAAVVAIHWALGPQEVEDECPADCRKCAEDLL